MASDESLPGLPTFPQLNSIQRAAETTPATRKKVELTPGHSLLDWIRLGNSGKDLTGVGGPRDIVWDDELAKHNSEDDAWTCVRGLVYNITPYFDFHPGGRDYLMKGAGIDATHLFDTYHQWVNAESMLNKCLIGKLKKRNSPQSSLRSLKKETPITGLSAPPAKKPEFVAPLAPAPIQPRYEWFQKDDLLMIVLYTKWPGLRAHHITVDYCCTDSKMRITARIKSKYYILSLQLEDEIETECENRYSLKINQKVGKAEIIMRKKVARKWIGVGKPLPDNGKLYDVNELILQEESGYRTATITDVKSLTHDVNLYKLKLPPCTRLPVPVGYHLYIYYEIENMTLQRPYTVVDPELPASNSQPQGNGVNGTENNQKSITAGEDLHTISDHVYLLIKLYENGVFTSALKNMNIGDTLRVSPADGNFDISKLQKCRNLHLLAAGTGITPMIRLINHSLNLSSVEIKLIFFNKTEDDIIWRKELDELAEKNEKFEVINVLSQASECWPGAIGRINSDILEQTLPAVRDGLLVCICGPSLFTQLGLRLLKEKGLKEDGIHAFTS